MIAGFGAYAGEPVLLQDCEWLFEDEAAWLEGDLQDGALEEVEPTYRALYLAGFIDDEDLPAEMLPQSLDWIFGPARIAA